MAWMKSGDNAATHPIVMRVEQDQQNEVFGFVMRCALWSASHTTDYWISEGITWMFGGTKRDDLVKRASKAGYWKAARHEGHRGFMLVDDPEFIHLRLKAEIDWEKQQRADASNPALTVPVRLRDGDGCRYCGQIVQWRARKGNRRGTYDHREPGRPATVDTLVVACGACNAGRKDDPEADARYPLRIEPLSPFYGEQTAAFLADHGHQVHVSSPPRPGSQPDPAPARPSDQLDPAPRDPAAGRTPRSADQLPTESGSAGSGRDGTGSGQGSGQGTGTGQGSGGPHRRRGRRGRPRTGGPE